MIGTQLTLAGALLLSKAIAGKQLTFSRGAFGDATQGGSVIEPTPAQIDDFNALINERMSLPIYAFEITGGDIVVSVKVKNDDVAEKFKAREAGLFAIDPDTQQEVLYGYCYEGNDGDTIYAKSSYCVLEYYVELVTTIANAADVTCLINIKEKIKAGTALSRMGDTLNLNIGSGASVNDDNQLVIPQYTLPTASSTVKGGIKVGENLYMTSDSLNATAYSLPTASQTVKGGVMVGENLYMKGDSINSSVEPYDDAFLTNRLNQLEINLANVFCKLNANNLDATANLWLLEDGNFNAATDRSTSRIRNSNFQNNWLSPDYDDATCLKPGEVFTVTSRGKAQEFKIANVRGSVNEANQFDYYIFTDEPLSEEFKVEGLNYIPNCNIHRTTAGIVDGYAYGPGTAILTSKNRVTWRGRVDSYVNIYSLPSLSSEYEIRGEGSLVDGTFSIV